MLRPRDARRRHDRRGREPGRPLRRGRPGRLGAARPGGRGAGAPAASPPGDPHRRLDLEGRRRASTPPSTGSGIRMIDGPRTTFCVLTRFETESFPRTWGLRSSRVCFTPWPATLKDDLESTDNGRVFAGGNSLRDYGPLIAAARRDRGAGRHRDERDRPRRAGSGARPQPHDRPAAPGRVRRDATGRRGRGGPAARPARTAPRDRRRTSTPWRAARRSSSPIRPGCATTSQDGETGLIVAPGDSGGDGPRGHAVARGPRRACADRSPGA